MSSVSLRVRLPTGRLADERAHIFEGVGCIIVSRRSRKQDSVTAHFGSLRAQAFVMPQRKLTDNLTCHKPDSSCSVDTLEATESCGWRRAVRVQISLCESEVLVCSRSQIAWDKTAASGHAFVFFFGIWEKLRGFAAKRTRRKMVSCV